MSLLLKVSPTKSTVVFSGDRRVTDATGPHDVLDKALPLSRFAVGGVVNYTRTVQKDTGEVQRDVHRQMKTFFHGQEVTAQTIKDFIAYSKSEHAAFIAKYRDGQPYEGAVGYYYVNISSYSEGRVLDYDLRFDLSKSEGLGGLDNCHICKTGALMPSGTAEINKALLSLSHPSLAKVNSSPELAILLGKRADCPFDTIFIVKAGELCRMVNHECSINATAITGRPSTISPNCDVLILDDNGVRPA